MLKGKAQTDFWEWYLLPETLSAHKLSAMFKFSNGNAIKVGFLSEPEICQMAMIIEFFDSVGILIGIYPSLYCDFVYHLNINKTYKRFSETTVTFQTRNEATEKAILKANEVYNESA